MKRVYINFTESDCQDMMDAVLEGNPTNEVFTWTVVDDNGEEIEAVITVGNDDEDEEEDED